MSTVNRGIITNGLVLCLDAANPKSIISGSTVWTDISRSGNNAVLTNGPIYNSSNGGTILFDGSDDFAITNNNIGISGNANITISVWFKLTNLTGSFRTLAMFGNVFSAGGGFGILQTGGGVLGAFFYQGTNGSTGVVISTNTWYNVVATKSSGAIGSTTTKLYINGVEKTLSFNTSAIPNFTDSKVYIANDAANEISNNGYISQVLFYNRALSSNEVLQNYNVTKSRFGY